MYAEIKYDGERVQVHKNGDQFEFFSRSLKAVQAHKVESTWSSCCAVNLKVCSSIGRKREGLLTTGLSPWQQHDFGQRSEPTIWAWHCGRGIVHNVCHLVVKVLLVDHATGKPLPFGTLGVHKVF